MAFDLTGLTQVLDALSSVSLIAGAVFVIFQLRQNAKLLKDSERQLAISNKQVEATLQQNRQQVLLSLVDRFTDDAYNFRRKKVRDIVRKYGADGWNGFLETNEDFEVRVLLSQYESTGYLAKLGAVDVNTLRDTIGPGVGYDWELLSSVVAHYRDTFDNKIYLNFEWLANAITKPES